MKKQKITELSKSMQAEIGDCVYALQVWQHGGYKLDFTDTTMCDSGVRWVEGAFGNMKIDKEYHGASDIYLFTENQFKRLAKAFNRYVKVHNITKDIWHGEFKTNTLLKYYKKYADRII